MSKKEENNGTSKKSLPVLKKSDFEAPLDVRWCPGCGDYSILAAMQKYLANVGKTQENYVFVSGIGCSSRFPYYMNTYGFHSIHGRAPAIASGVKIANPGLSVWVITGDGDALSIGGNHFLHALRRNLDINIVLFNNRIYGLTKGQYSPTSPQGKATKSSPDGAPDQPLNPVLLALGSQATFIARCLDVDVPMMTKVFEAADAHRGTSFIEIYQNCKIFYDGAFESVSERKSRPENMLAVEHGKPLMYGKEKNRGIRIRSTVCELVEFEPGEKGQEEQAAINAGVTVYDQTSGGHATALARMPGPPEFPTPMGVIYREDHRSTLEEIMYGQLEAAAKKRPPKGDADKELNALFRSADTWTVE